MEGKLVEPSSPAAARPVGPLDDLIRSLSSAFLFGVSVIFTEEIWAIGASAALGRLVVFLVLALLANWFLGYYAGFSDKQGKPAIALETIKAFSVGLVCTVVTLAVLNRIKLVDPMMETVGKVTMAVIPFSIGAFLADVLFPLVEAREEVNEEVIQKPWRATLADMGATMAGGIFLGLPIAPTHEVSLLASEMTFWHELGLIGLSLVVSYLIVFESCPKEVPSAQVLPFLQRPWVETVFSYAISLVLAVLLLVGFNQLDPATPLVFQASQIVTLAFPIAVGGAAGRLAL
jgi:putative integral membrane protein (TIGR02587 family)